MFMDGVKNLDKENIKIRDISNVVLSAMKKD
jgi:hypothetical protein